jgi:signal transduction histidine kinase
MSRARHFRLSSLVRSLRFQLFLMFLLMVLITVSIVALSTAHSTTGSFNQYVSNKNQKSLNLALAWLNTYNEKSRGQPDLQFEQSMVEQIGHAYGVRLLVVVPGRPYASIVADSEGKLQGSAFTPLHSPAKERTQSNARADASVYSCESLPPHVIVVTTTSLTYCNDAVISGSGRSTVPEQTFLNSLNGSILLGVLLAGLIALVLAFAFSYTIIHPIARMTAVARRMEKGDLNSRVSVKSHNEIGELAHALNTMAEGLQRSEHLRRNMLNDVAHELRTPLTNIRGYLEALQDRVVDPTPELLASLYEESSLLTRLVADLQELSMAEAGQLYLARLPLALDECALKAVQMLQFQAAEKGIALCLDVPRDLPAVEADPGRVAQILRNLLTNALLHTAPGGRVTLSAVEDDQTVTVSVRDTGCGIEAQHLPYVFERFYRADSSRTRTTGGSGLGLAIVKQIVQAHGGSVHVESQPGTGSCFSFSLPLHPATTHA